MNELRRIERLERKLLINNLIFIIMMGAFLNIGVVMNNNLKMPVYYNNIDEAPQNLDKNYIAFDNFENVKYPYFSDIFKIKNLWFSIGDTLIVAGFLLVISLYAFTTINQLIYAIKGNNKIKRNNKNGTLIND